MQNTPYKPSLHSHAPLTDYKSGTSDDENPGITGGKRRDEEEGLACFTQLFSGSRGNKPASASVLWLVSNGIINLM